MAILPAGDASGRVARKTAPETNAQIRERTLQRIRGYEHADHPLITARIDELRREWDVERMLEARRRAWHCQE